MCQRCNHSPQRGPSAVHPKDGHQLPDTCYLSVNHQAPCCTYVTAFWGLWGLDEEGTRSVGRLAQAHRPKWESRTDTLIREMAKVEVEQPLYRSWVRMDTSNRRMEDNQWSFPQMELCSTLAQHRTFMYAGTRKKIVSHCERVRKVRYATNLKYSRAISRNIKRRNVVAITNTFI